MQHRSYTSRFVIEHLHIASHKNELLHEQSVFTTVRGYIKGGDTNTVIILRPSFLVASYQILSDTFLSMLIFDRTHPIVL